MPVRPFALDRRPADLPDRLRRALSSANFAEAAVAFREDDHVVSTALADSSLAAGRDEREVQGYLQGAPTPGGELSSGATALGAGDAHTSWADVNRWQIQGQGDVAPGDQLEAAALPFAAALTLDAKLPGGLSLPATAYAGSTVKGVKAGLAGDLGGGALGVGLVHEDKVKVLGPTRAAADGTTLHLARFTSSIAPGLEADLTLATDHLGGGVRAAGYLRRATAYEKWLSTGDLAKVMRQRDRWCRNLVELALAVRLAAGVRPTSLQSLARDIAQVDGWLPGEKASWRAGHGFMLGLGLGAMGGRLIGTFSLSSDTTLTLEREDDDHVALTVEPGRQSGLRLALEARLLADVALDLGRSARHLRTWRFHTGYMSSRVALARALGGQLPGILLPGRSSPVQSSLDHATLRVAESLPFGVEAVESAFALESSRALTLGSLRLPELIGAQSLFARTCEISSVASSTSEAGTRHSLTSSRSSSSGLLSLGTASETSLVELVSQASLEPGSAPRMAPSALKASFEVATASSGATLRRRLGRRLTAATGTPMPMADAAKTTGYAVRIAVELDLDDLARIGRASGPEIDAAAKRAGLRPAAAHQARSVIATFLRDGHGEGAVAELRFIARFGYPGLKLLRLLAGHATVPEPEVDNAEHIRLLRDFLKLEIYALGARDRAHARKALSRAEDLGKRLAAAAREVTGDGALRHAGEDVVDDHLALIAALAEETEVLRDQVREALED